MAGNTYYLRFASVKCRGTRDVATLDSDAGVFNLRDYSWAMSGVLLLGKSLGCKDPLLMVGIDCDQAVLQPK
jgi:hypothetical protein